MSLAPGAHIGPYEILALLGAGGMGEVYRARDPRLGRAVAIKILLAPHGASPAQLERFRREARSIARISHLHICTVHDVGEHDGVPFLVMELLEGETLAERLERGAIPLDRALAMGVQIAEALSAAHKKGVVHRDLKPSNVMLTASGVKLLDFGLAKLRDAEYTDVVAQPTQSLSLTDPGTVLGTLPYMAPEQIAGDDADARTDIFSFGVVLYEMIVGRRPFVGKTRASLMAAIVGAEAPSLSGLQPALPRALERLIGRCLAKDVEDRWQTARDLAAELQWIADAGSDAGPAVAHAARGGQRVVLLGGLAALALVGVVLAAATALAPRRVPVAEPLPVTHRRGVVSSARFTPDGRSFVYSASWEGRPYGVFLGRPESPDARNLGLETGRILSISRAGDMAVLFGPQNIQRAFGVRTLARIPMAGGVRRDLLDGVVDADWIPGTEQLAVIRDPGSGRPWTVEFPAGTTVHEARAAWSLRVSPDGSRIAFFEGPALFSGATTPQDRITVIDRSGRTSTLSGNWSGIGLAWAPSGTEIWFTATHGGAADPAGTVTDASRTGAPSLQAVSLAGAERTVYRAPDWLMLHDIAADGRVLLSRNTIRIGLACQPPDAATEEDLSWMYASNVTGLSADGQTVIFNDNLGGRTPSGNPTIFRRSMDGSAAVPLGEGNGGTLSPDGRWVLARLKDSLVLHPTGAGSMVTLPKGSLAGVGGGDWLSDSKRIVFTGFSKDNRPRIYLQEVPAGAPLAVTPEGVVSGPASVRNDRSILGRQGDRWFLYPLNGGDAQPVAALAPRDFPLEWSEDGGSLYTVESVQGAAPPSQDVFRVDLATGRRVVWKTLAPADAVGVESIPGNARMAPDGRASCYSYMRRLGDLFVVDGLQ